MTSFAERYGPWAIVAGASEGLGAAFARALATRGLNLLLLARRGELLEEVAAPLRASVFVETLVVDLGGTELERVLSALAAKHDIGLVVYNAATSLIGPFVGQSLADKQRVLDVNCRGPLTVAHVFAERMQTRRKGGLLFMSSLTAFWGSPFVATYGASKAFNLALGEGLWGELKKHGVDVLVCCAGATRTPGFLRLSAESGRSRAPSLAPEQVAEEALMALGRRSSMVPGAFNRFASFLLNRLLPRRVAVSIMGAQTAKLLPR